MNRSDRIFLPDLSFDARVGVLPGESDLPQELSACLEIQLDLGTAAATDAIDQTFDYRRIPEILAGASAQGPCDLLETLAGRILTAILEDRRVQAAGVRLAKRSLPLGPRCGPVSVELWRRTEPT